jgi:hypothetical protein
MFGQLPDKSMPAGLRGTILVDQHGLTRHWATSADEPARVAAARGRDHRQPPELVEQLRQGRLCQGDIVAFATN